MALFQCVLRERKNTDEKMTKKNIISINEACQLVCLQNVFIPSFVRYGCLKNVFCMLRISQRRLKKCLAFTGWASCGDLGLS